MTSNIEVPISTTTTTMSDYLLNQSIEHNLKRLIILNSLELIICLIILFECFYTNHINYNEDQWKYILFKILIMIFNIINTILGLTLSIYEKYKYSNSQFNSISIDLNHWNFIHFICNIISLTCSFLLFLIEFIHWSTNLFNLNQIYHHINDIRLLIILFLIIIGFCQSICVIENRILIWTPKYRYSRFLLAFSSLLLMIISMISIRMNRQIHMNILSLSWKLFQITSIYIFLCGTIAFVIAFVFGGEQIGPNQFQKRLQYLFNILSTIAFISILISISILLFHSMDLIIDQIIISQFIHSNILLSIVQSFLLLIAIGSLHTLISTMQSEDRNGLTIERIRLIETSPIYLKHWVRAIDTLNDIPDGMSGESALQLMMAYENVQLENIESIVLRIGRPDRSLMISNNQWDDTEAIVLFKRIHNYDVTSIAHVNGFWGRVFNRIRHLANYNNDLNPILLRFGLIGYQWPFRTSIFFTKFHEDSLLRSAHVLESIIHWNQIQKSKQYCDILILPTLSTERIAKAIPLTGFFPLLLPPTHLLDLRSHHGKTWKEYLKTLKKDNRRHYIEQFLAKGGTFEEIHDFNLPGVAEIVCQLWRNVAENREKNHEPGAFLKPSIELIHSIGNQMNHSYRSILFLRFNNEIILSTIIHKFPFKLLTFDLPGLIYEKARPLKAYFALLQWAAKEALEKKYDFVDFGPTTPEPKLDLGCQSIPSEAGAYTRNPILAFAIQQAGKTINHLHQKKENQHFNKSNLNLKQSTTLETQPLINSSSHQHILSNTIKSKYPQRKQKRINNKQTTTNVEKDISILNNENQSSTSIQLPIEYE